MVSIAKSFIIAGLVVLMIATIVCYQDWIQVMFLMCWIVSAFLVLFGSVLTEVIIDLARKKSRH
jgi:multisubunit Na+/H+ antiporter MnhG subunit